MGLLSSSKCRFSDTSKRLTSLGRQNSRKDAVILQALFMDWNPAAFVLDPSAEFPCQRSTGDFNKVSMVEKCPRKITLIGGGGY